VTCSVEHASALATAPADWHRQSALMFSNAMSKKGEANGFDMFASSKPFA